MADCRVCRDSEMGCCGFLAGLLDSVGSGIRIGGLMIFGLMRRIAVIVVVLYMYFNYN